MAKKKSVKMSKLPKELAETKEALMLKLAELKVTTVDVEWNGSGDSGGVESVTAKDEEQDVEVELDDHEVTINSRNESYGTNGKAAKVTYTSETKKLGEAIDQFCMDWVDHHGYGGWYNDEGGCGTAVFDVKKKTVELSHSHYEQVTNLVVEENV